ncbi:MAG: S8 family serine peptidase [candidate division WOR-3 bacterium]
MNAAVRAMILVLLCLAPAAGRRLAHYDLGPARRFAPAPAAEIGVIHFANGFSLDMRTGETDAPADLRRAEPAGPAHYLVQFRGPIERRWLDDIHRLGIRPLCYFPDYAYLVKLDPYQKVQVELLPEVSSVGLFQPAFKLQDVLLSPAGGRSLALMVMPGERPEPVLDFIAASGGTVGEVSVSGFGTIIRADVPGGLERRLAQLDEVFWIQEWTEPEVCNNSCQWVVQSGWRASAPPDTSLAARPVWARGVRGQRTILSTTDTGLNVGHNQFRDPALSVTPPGIWPGHRKVVAFKLFPGASETEVSYHGSHVNGTVAGDDSVTGGTSYYEGMARDARLYFVDLTNASGSFVVGTDLTSLWDTVYQGAGLPDSVRPIRQHSGSWRWYNSTGAYLLQDATTDYYCWLHKDFLNIMAAGNEGSSGYRNIGSPALAKNVLTVGATGNGTSSNARASFSSRGPAQDGRIKPTVCAPGVGLWSAQASGQSGYSQLSGTSMATPAVNGSVGLIRCYLREGYYPSGAQNPADAITYISSALLRAMAVNSADPNISSTVVPDSNIGWGRIDVDSVLYFSGDSRKLIVRDDTSGLRTGEYREVQFRVNASMPLRVALAWTDTAAAPSANPTLVNDLNLLLVAPSGTYYRGNQYSGGQSVANPSNWDNRNTEECCRVNSPDTGLWTVRVYGQNVATGARQPFGLCITGGITTELPDVGVTAIVAPAGTIDTTDVVAPACSVYNYGNTTASYSVRMKVGLGYDTTAQVTNHAPGTALRLSFPAAGNWPRGNLVVACSTRLAGDAVPANDSALGTVFVRVRDAAANQVSAPTGAIDSGTVVVPQAQVENRGNSSATFYAILTVTDGYRDSTLVSDLAPGATAGVSFRNWTALQRGSFIARCSTGLAGDAVPANNRASTNGFVQVRDGGILGLVSPAPVVDSAAGPQPVRIAVRNHGNVAGDYVLVADIEPGWHDSVSVPVIAAGATDTVQLDDWTPPGRGTFRWSVRLRLSGDMVPQNDTASGAITTRVRDVAVQALLAPSETLRRRDPVVPRVRVRNAGTTEETFDVRLRIGENYVDQQTVTRLEAGDTFTVVFVNWLPDWGSYAVACTTLLAGDAVEENNTLAGNVLVELGWAAGWHEVSPLPLEPSGRAVKDGAWLVMNTGRERLYALKGNKTGDFYCYDPLEGSGGTWSGLPAMPDGAETKKPGKGSAGCSDNAGAVYAVKGNNTFGFWRYDIDSLRWEQLPDVPAGTSGRKVKAGADMAFMTKEGVGGVYLMKGYRCDFFRFNVLSGAWEVLPLLPSGSQPKWDKGSWLSSDGERYIFAHKAKFHELWAFDCWGDTWESSPRAGMPFTGASGKKKKSRDGGSAAFWNDAIYAFKGGNTCEFWKYIVAEDRWVESDSLPSVGSTGKRKRVKAGADIVAFGQQAAFFALKGNKTAEFWRYLEPPVLSTNAPGRTGVMAGGMERVPARPEVVPTLVAAGFAEVRCGPGRLAVWVYDAAGRLVRAQAFAGSTGSAAVRLDLRGLAPGIYLVRLEGETAIATQKLVVR